MHGETVKLKKRLFITEE